MIFLAHTARTLAPPWTWAGETQRLAERSGENLATAASPPSFCYGNERGKHAWWARRATAGWAGEEACDLAPPFRRATCRRMKPRATRRSPPRQHFPRSTCARARARGRREQPAAAHPPPSRNCAGSSIAHAVISRIIGTAGNSTACSSTKVTCAEFCENDLGQQEQHV